MLREEGDSLIEIRNEVGLSGGLDELVATRADIHLEQMQLDHWWMRIDAGGKSIKLDFRIKDGLLTVDLSNHACAYAALSITSQSIGGDC
jgi:hypothetical protein